MSDTIEIPTLHTTNNETTNVSPEIPVVIKEDQIQTSPSPQHDQNDDEIVITIVPQHEPPQNGPKLTAPPVVDAAIRIPDQNDETAMGENCITTQVDPESQCGLDNISAASALSDTSGNIVIVSTVDGTNEHQKSGLENQNGIQNDASADLSADEDGEKPLEEADNRFESILPAYETISNWQVPFYYTVWGMEKVGLWLTSFLGLDTSDYTYVINAAERFEAMDGARANPDQPNN